jgi:tRNA acetyltransferase TAN1
MMAVREHCSRRYPDLFKDDDAEDEKSDAAAVTNVEDAIAAEAAKEKASVQQGPFGMIETKTKGLLFIEFHNEKMNPVEICADCLKEVRDTGRTKTKYLVRMTPVLATCYAKYEEIKKAVQPILDKHLNASMEATTYCIVYKKRSNEDLDRLKLINELAEKVDKKHKVDLTMPKTAILIDIMTNVCCIGVCDDYFALRKYNVQVSRSAHPAAPRFRSRAQVPQKSRW